MQYCDAKCGWCARHFWKWVKARMRAEYGAGDGGFAKAAATSVGAQPDRQKSDT